MKTTEIANRLIELCNKGKFETAQKELFAADAISVEPYATPDFAKETQGLQAIFEKGKKFDSMVEEYHSTKCSTPLVTENSFAITMTMDVTMKNKGRMKFSELCVYEIKEGKIAAERFFM
ncbi:MAG: nuclear transport factor 2 family protein [Chitinophaga sp.]|uniref:SnoaL-like domain-containing protein n=1 Tax=Chitinophaga sp. TaxID=1869181 RepID=UPI0025BB1603|nr:SnoaL-like domain-containing protein [Chitinophaga sp.]MBV8253297.1 nuclear transport factor 2 family protein [Chitinophaga sp.]